MFEIYVMILGRPIPQAAGSLIFCTVFAWYSTGISKWPKFVFKKQRNNLVSYSFVSRVAVLVCLLCLTNQIRICIAKFPLREHSTNLPCRRKYYGLRTSTILYLLHLTLTTDHWLARNVWCLKMPVCGSGVWLSNPCGLTSLFDLLGHSASDTSPQERMVSLVGCLNSEITRTTFSKLIFVYNFNVMCCMIW